MSTSGLSSWHCHQATNMTLQAAVLGYHHRSQVTYSEGWRRWSGIEGDHKAWRGEWPPVADCSAYVTWCIWNGLHHFHVRDVVNNQRWERGWTGTMLENGKSVSKLFPGCAVIYGNFPGEHTAIYTGGGLVVSHGNSAGPQLIPWNYRPGPYHFRSYIY